MSTPVAALLRVRPSPSTLAESRAIYQHFASQVQGRIVAFKRLTDGTSSSRKDADSALFYTLLVGTPVEQMFTVEPTYPDPKQEDPFNIRGLQSRKPHPASRVFNCTIEHDSQLSQQRQSFPNLGGLFSSTAPSVATTAAAAASSPSGTNILSSFYSRSHYTKRRDWLQHVLTDLNVPDNLRSGLGTPVLDNGLDTTRHHQPNLHTNRAASVPHDKMINVNGLMPLYNAATTHAPVPQYISIRPAVRPAPTTTTTSQAQKVENTDINRTTLLEIAKKLDLSVPILSQNFSQSSTPSASTTPTSATSERAGSCDLCVKNLDSIDHPPENAVDEDGWILHPLDYGTLHEGRRRDVKEPSPKSLRRMDGKKKNSKKSHDASRPPAHDG